MVADRLLYFYNRQMVLSSQEQGFIRRISFAAVCHKTVPTNRCLEPPSYVLVTDQKHCSLPLAVKGEGLHQRWYEILQFEVQLALWQHFFSPATCFIQSDDKIAGSWTPPWNF